MSRAGAAVLLALVLAPVASAGVTVRPARLEPGATAPLAVVVTNDRRADMTSVQLGIPPGATLTPVAVSGWAASSSHGAVAWSGRLGPGERATLPLIATLPARPATIVFGARETFADGTTDEEHPRLALRARRAASTLARVALVLAAVAAGLAAITVSLVLGGPRRFRKASGPRW